MTGEMVSEAPPDALDFSDTTSTFGDRLTFAREALGLDQAQFSRRIGVKVQTLRNWEEDRSEPRANKLQMLSGMLNVPIVWLMSGQGGNPPLSEPHADSDFEDTLVELRKLRAEQMRIAEKMALVERRLRAAIE